MSFDVVNDYRTPSIASVRIAFWFRNKEFG